MSMKHFKLKHDTFGILCIKADLGENLDHNIKSKSGQFCNSGYTYINFGNFIPCTVINSSGYRKTEHRLEFADGKDASGNTPIPFPEADADGFQNIPDGYGEELPFR